MLELKSRLPFVAVVTAVVVSMTISTARAQNYALLVGVSKYPSLAEELQLVGPANDVKLVRELLQKKGFSDDHVQVLADGLPQAGDPTRQNIIAGLDKIVAQAKRGDFVYLHFAGHGSQQPSSKDKVPPEPDGLDEIFLPRDIGKWNDSTSAVDNALVDSDMNPYITKLRNKGAFVWAVFDSCHSGTMTRGLVPEDVHFRQVEPESLGIPHKAMEAAEKEAPKTRGGPPQKTGILGEGSSDGVGKGGFVAFYAAGTIEKAPEMRLPQGEPGREPHGLFSYVLAETLEKYQGITYRQLGQQVHQRYASLGMKTPTPLWEGTALDAPVFGVEAQAAVKQWPLRINKGELSIGAGSLQQFSEGAIFAVVPTAVSPDKEIIGYLRGDKLTPLSSIVNPVEYGGKKALSPDQLKAGQYVRLVDPNLRLSLRVALPPQPPLPRLNKKDPPSPKSDSALEKVARQLIKDFRAKPVEGIRIEWVESGKEADLRLLLSDNKLWLLSPDGQWVKEGPSKTHSIDLNVPKDKLNEKIIESFQRISKATNLLRVASFFGNKDSVGVAKGLEVKATLIKKDGGARAPLDIAVLPEFHDGDQVEFVFHNKGRVMVDVTALYFDSEYGITAMYPDPGRLNRIEIDAKDKVTIQINADTTGTERLMIIAVDAQPETTPSDFSFLEQPSLDRTRGYLSSTDVLFRETGFGVTTRGATKSKSPMGDAEVKVFDMKVVGN